MENSENQVPLFKLIFTHNWEDPECDHQALKIKSDDTLVTITSGGCNVLGFLLFDPKLIYSIDINPTQSWLLELKAMAIRHLEYEEFAALMGLTIHTNRMNIYQKLRNHLSSEAVIYWDSQAHLLSKGLIMNGKYERFIRLAGRFISLLQGKSRVLGLFKSKTLDEQHRYFDTVWDTRRFHFLFKALFNKHMLAKRGLVADYFHFDDGSKSFAESFYKRSRKAFRDLPIKGNYFLSLYLLGHYQNHTEVPEYLKKEHFDVLKARVDRIRIITSDAQSWLDTIPEASINGFALSNICELMSEAETERLFRSVCRTASPGARVIFRNLMIPREVPETLRSEIVKDEALSSRIYNNDRSFVYGKVAAYVIPKTEG